jgi:hypothetical protein
VYVNVNVSRLSIPECHISNLFVMCMSMSMSVDCPFLMTIRNEQSRDTDIDIHKKKEVRDSTIMHGQSTDTDIDIHKKKTLETIPDCPISNVFFLCMSMSVSLDCPFLTVPSLASCSCVCQCQCL